MHLKNNLFSICLIITLVIIGCSEEKTQLISNTHPKLPDKNYNLNLKSLDSGKYLESVTITWNETTGAVKLIENDLDDITPTGNSHTFGMTPGKFRDILIQVIMDDSTYVDSIQIFTRPVYPVTGFEFDVEIVWRGNEVYDMGETFTDLDLNDVWNNGEEFIDKMEKKYHRILNWSATKEPKDSFQKYTLFRSENGDQLIEPETCGCEITTLAITDSSYIDSSFAIIEELGNAAFYYMVQVSAGNFKRNSYIDKYTNFTSPLKIVLDTSNVSTNNNEFIQITWEPVINSNTLYQYEIWRSPDEELSDTTLLAIITNPEQGKFMDRNAGNGTSWYYSVAVVDINGNPKFSDFIAGWSKP